MEKESVEQEKILRKYILKNHKKYPIEILKKEVIEKGYSFELFEKILKEILNVDSEPTKKGELLNSKSVVRDDKEFVMVPIEKEKLSEALKSKKAQKSFFTPTQVMTYSFCIILLAVTGMSLANSFSFSSFSYEDAEGFGSSFEIGYPWIFISVSMEDETPFKFNFLYLLLCFSVYILIAYILDLILSNSFEAIRRSIKQDRKEEILMNEKDYGKEDNSTKMKDRISTNQS